MLSSIAVAVSVSIEIILQANDVKAEFVKDIVDTYVKYITSYMLLSLFIFDMGDTNVKKRAKTKKKHSFEFKIIKI